MSRLLNGGNWKGIVSLEVEIEIEVEVKAEWLRLEEEVRCVKRAPVGICGFSYYGHKHLLSSFPQYPYCLMEGIVIQSPASFNDQIDYSTDTHFHTPLRYLHAFPCHPSFSTSLLSSSIVSLSLSSSSIFQPHYCLHLLFHSHYHLLHIHFQKLTWVSLMVCSQHYTIPHNYNCLHSFPR